MDGDMCGWKRKVKRGGTGKEGGGRGRICVEDEARSGKGRGREKDQGRNKRTLVRHK